MCFFIFNPVIPTFIDEPSNIDAVVGSTVLFNCRATAFPKPKISWLRQGQVVSKPKIYKN